MDSFERQRIFAALFFLLSFIYCINGLKCWTCNNARSEKDCIDNGKPEICRGQGMSCQTEIRYHGGTGFSPFITKRCKQTNACQSNQRQNPGAAAGPTQCNSGVRNSVCRCCCRGPLCNRKDFWCSGNNNNRGQGSGNAARKCNVLTAPENGSKQCKFRKAEGDIGTRCTFTCDAGFHLNGAAVSICRPANRRAKPKFNNEPPDCEEIPGKTGGDVPVTLFDCNDAPAEPLNGGRSCLRNEYGVVCSYFCSAEETLVGDGIVTCNRSSGWDGPTPECNPRCKKLPEIIPNGILICNDAEELGSVCEYVCNPGSELIGSPTTTCIRKRNRAMWSKRVPRCTMSAALPLTSPCEDLGTLEHGEISCIGESGGIGTICEIGCVDRGFALRPANVTQMKCLPNGWSDKKPCCSRLCPPFAQMDVVIIMDSSSSVQTEGWDKMKIFVKDVIRTFSISDSSAHFSVFRFNGKVDQDSQILFGDYANDKSGLLEAVGQIPYDGRGTRLGKALTHARDVVLKTDNRENTKDLVWVLTDGISKDEVSDVSADLRNSGVEIFALGISHPTGRLSAKQLLSVGGDSDHVIITEDGLDSLSKELVDKVAESICEQSCG